MYAHSYSNSTNSMEGIETIRADNRTALLTDRNQRRRLEVDQRRPLSKTSETSINVQDIANNLKTRCLVSSEVLASLKNQLLTESNICVVLKTHGALRGLIREFTGTDTGKQMAAAECLCNLALSELHTSQIVAKATGAYLLPCLRSLNTQLAVTCAWTIGNLAGCHEKVCRILIQQGALAALTNLLSETVHKEIHDATCYALIHFVYILNNDFRDEALADLVRVLATIEKSGAAYHLLYLLSCHHHFLNAHTTGSEFISNIIDGLLREQEYLQKEHGTNSSDKLIHMMRILGNICLIANSSDYVLKYWRTPKYYSHVEYTLSSECVRLRGSVLWLLGNIFNSCTQNSDNAIFFESISHKIL